MVRDLFLTNSGEKDAKNQNDVYASEMGNTRPVIEQDKTAPTHVSKSQAMRAVVATKSDESLHPVVRMGWKPLCNVTCNGMNGIFWGGHDRDVYIQCTSPPYAGLPLVDVAYGGCMMTCSHFERISGRELSKKWKESIHVVLSNSKKSQKPGQKMTMYKWLKQEAAREDLYGDGIVGKKIWVCWFADARFYQGTVVEYKKASGKHVVQYTAGRVTEDLHLPLEKVETGLVEPLVCPHPDDVQPSKITIQNPVWNQNSDVSLNVALDELQNSPSYAAALRGVVRTRAQISHEEDSSKMPKSPPPKRTVSPSEQLLRRMAETYIDSPGDQSGDTTVKHIPPPPLRDEDPKVLYHSSLTWMHRLAMELERDIQEAYASFQD